MKDKAIVFFTKAPELGRIKTRLEPFLTKELCVELQTAFIKDIYNCISTMGINIIINYSAIGDLDKLKNITHREAKFIKQEGNDIGDKMYNAISTALKDYKRVVLIGSDIPLINHKDIELAFDILEKNEVVISPTYDGGYYLIGMKQANLDLFKMKYSTSSVYEETIEKIKSLGLSYGEGHIQLDIDDKKDFMKLYKILKEDDNIICENTRIIVNKFMRECDKNV
ncbi:hypothetical protein SAMN02745248_00468 [Hathewaya proteolytica DSM 3090]|uniref:2-phospho-L-lactate guanylyltransferase n=1 Tax=Hathewaya proteolytica DSM 3090 TaxID=1121331 RepID=A0A1M6KH59_9CLOT|nr:TIGR04282 family arsenosugar biosynthesis glycosyltransferase [Hathewaya proteolytica]SHJ58268.1 hypothetical protein SAMN02745248_00468 [Hathewaya proteolytica DSM 3090]